MRFPFLHPKKYQHLTKILVSEQNLIHNYQLLQTLKPFVKIAPVLKSNAYGHDLVLVAKIFDQLKPPFLLVDSLYEAYQLYKAHIKSPILIMGYTDPENYKVKLLPFHYSVFDLQTAQVLNQYQPGANIHLFVDTGMHREGISIDELETFVKQLKQLKNIKITGLMSHLADADNPDDDSLNQLQLNNFLNALKILRKHGIDPKWKHLQASAGAFKIDHPELNLIRTGIALYGYQPLDKKDRAFKPLELKPALEFTTRLIQIKHLQPGEIVSYNATFKATHQMKLGVLGAGYNDGVDRRLSNIGWVKVKDWFCPIVGRVCMNLTLIDLTSIKQINVGEPVTIYSANLTDKNSLPAQAKIAKTINHDLLTGLSPINRREKM